MKQAKATQTLICGGLLFGLLLNTAREKERRFSCQRLDQKDCW